MPNDGPKQPAQAPAVIPQGLVREAVLVLLVHGDMTEAERTELIVSITDDAFRAELVGDNDVDEEVQQQIVSGIRDAQVLVGLLRDHAESMHGLPCGVECIALQLHAVLMVTDARITALALDDAALFLGYCARQDVLTVCAGQDDEDIADIAEAFAEDDDAASDPRETFTAIITVIADADRLDALADTIAGVNPECAVLAHARSRVLRSAPRSAPHP